MDVGVVDRGFGSRFIGGRAACTGLQFRQACNSGGDLQLDIPSQSVAAVLRAYGKATGLEPFYAFGPIVRRWFHAMMWVAIARPDAVIGCQVRSHERGWPIGLLAIVIVVAIAGFVTPSCSLAAEANQDVDELPMLFDIPAQPLAAALEHFMEATKVSVVVDTAVIAERTSAALRGHFSPEGALRSLLAGTGLEPRPIGSRAYTLDPLPHTGAVQPVPRFAYYAMAIQQAVTNALCQRDETRPTHYRMVMRLWLSPGGTVTHVQLGGSTGNPSLDMAIGNALERISIGAPVPAGLPQPVKLAILPRVTPSDAACPPNDAGGQPAQNLSR